MELIPGNRIYKCSGCNQEVHVNMMLSGVPHCERGEYVFIKICKKHYTEPGGETMQPPIGKCVKIATRWDCELCGVVCKDRQFPFDVDKWRKTIK